MRFYKPVSGGVELPELSNPATAENIQTGFEAINGNGEKVTGTHVEAEIPELPTLSNPAAAAQIITGYDAINGDGNKVSGSMANNGAVSKALNCGGAYTVPAGYHNGNGVVTANSLTSQTAADAAAADIANGKTAWVNGGKVTGNHVCKTVGELTADADATAADIMSGKTAYVNGEKITGEAVAGAEYEEITLTQTDYNNGYFVYTLDNVTTIRGVGTTYSSSNVTGIIDLTGYIYTSQSTMKTVALTVSDKTVTGDKERFSKGLCILLISDPNGDVIAP